jgi:hypothetical protein
MSVSHAKKKSPARKPTVKKTAGKPLAKKSSSGKSSKAGHGWNFHLPNSLKNATRGGKKLTKAQLKGIETQIKKNQAHPLVYVPIYALAGIFLPLLTLKSMLFALREETKKKKEWKLKGKKFMSHGRKAVEQGFKAVEKELGLK